MPVDLTGVYLGLLLWIGGTVWAYRRFRATEAARPPVFTPVPIAIAKTIGASIVWAALGFAVLVAYEWSRGRMPDDLKGVFLGFLLWIGGTVWAYRRFRATEAARPPVFRPVPIVPIKTIGASIVWAALGIAVLFAYEWCRGRL